MSQPSEPTWDASQDLARRQALQAYHILDTPAEKSFDDLVHLATHLCDAPMGILSLVDETRQWFKAVVGLPIRESDRTSAFCHYTIRQQTPFMVADACQDPRFAHNPFVLGEPYIRFYAGIPLVSSLGPALGSLAVMDRVPRQLTPIQLGLLQCLAQQAMDQMQWRMERRQHHLTAQHLATAQRIGQMGSWELIPQDRHLTWSDEVYRIFGIQPSDFDGTLDAFLALVHPEDQASLQIALEKLMRGEAPLDRVHRILQPTGEIRYVREQAQCFCPPGATALTWIGTVQDVTPQIQAKQASHQYTQELQQLNHQLQISEERFRGIFAAAATGILSTSPDRHIVSANPAFCEMLGYSEAELRHRDILSLTHPEDRNLSHAKFQDLVAGACKHYVIEKRYLTKRGAIVWCRVSVSILRDEAGQPLSLIGVAEDITSRKEAESALERFSARLHTTLESMTDAFYLLDEQWRFTYLNSEAERVLHVQAGELLGRSVWETFPETRASVLFAEYHRAVQEQSARHFKYYYPPREDWFEINAYPSTEGLAVYFRRITERLAIEAQLRQSQRLELVGQLTGGVAHDFNNLLTVILGNAELLTEMIPPDSPLHPLAQMIGSAAQRGALLTQRLLAFARRQALNPKVVDVNQLITQMDDLLRRTLGEQIMIEHSFCPDLWPTAVDPVQLESALLNLCINARDAMPRGGHLILETANIDLDQHYTTQNFEVQPGEYVRVTVTDTGTGIAPEDLAHVFEPFFTTKAQGKGTGLGLSMVYGFIKQSSGHVKIYSELGEGTTVKLYFPRYEQVGEAASETPVRQSARGGTEQILLVEDDPLVRRYAQEQLESLGYYVRVADNGPNALAIIRQHNDIDLLFTDVVMPGGMNGRELADAAQQICPQLKVLFTSGFSENAITHQGRLDPGVYLLGKPYGKVTLAQKIREVLDESP